MSNVSLNFSRFFRLLFFEMWTCMPWSQVFLVRSPAEANAVRSTLLYPIKCPASPHFVLKARFTILVSYLHSLTNGFPLFLHGHCDYGSPNSLLGQLHCSTFNRLLLPILSKALPHCEVCSEVCSSKRSPDGSLAPTPFLP